MKERMIRVPVREQNPKVRATNLKKYAWDTMKKKLLKKLQDA